MEHRQKTPTNWALAIGIINFILLIIVMSSLGSISSKLGTLGSSSDTNTTSTSSNVSGQNANILQSLTALDQKVTLLSTDSKKPFSYLSCSGSVTTIGSISNTTSTCYPY